MNRNSRPASVAFSVLPVGIQAFIPPAAQPQTVQACVAESADMTVAFGDPASCEIKPAGDIDIYYLSGVAGQTVRIEITMQTLR